VVPAAERKQRGAWYTPDDLVSTVVEQAISADAVGRWTGGRQRAVRIVDPACGDGRFLRAAARRVTELGGTVELVGVDIDRGAVMATRASLGAFSSTVHQADALAVDWSQFDSTRSAGPPRTDRGFDLVIGNPPFLSQMATATTRGGASARGGGPYADAAVEFLALAAELVDWNGGRVAFVLPQSLLSARDASAVRATYDSRSELIWSWWTGERVFDAQVLTCALAFEFGREQPASGHRTTEPDGARLDGVRPDGARPDRPGRSSWSRVVTSRSGVPDVPAQFFEQGAGTLGDRARLNANFRDEYYGMIPAVGDHAHGPKLVTSGLIDPGRLLWGERPITFAKRRFDRPRIDLAELGGKMPRWARERSVPKVLIANQTKIIEAVADPDGSTLPGVPVVAAYPMGDQPSALARATWEIAAVLTSPIASAWAWHRSAGTGMSADAIRLGPVLLADLPWPRGDLGAAVSALRAHDVRNCARAVHRAFGLDERRHDGRLDGGPDGELDDDLMAWWLKSLERIEARQPNVTRATR
jgi:SAM-dependent methyltransferase